MSIELCCLGGALWILQNLGNSTKVGLELLDACFFSVSDVAHFFLFAFLEGRKKICIFYNNCFLNLLIILLIILIIIIFMT